MPHNEPIPVLVVADEGYVGQDEVQDEVGAAFRVTLARGLDDALRALHSLDHPLVLVPHNLSPLSGATICAHLDAQARPFVGLLMVDEPDLAGLASHAVWAGIDSVIPRPLRPGQLGMHLRAAAASRARARALGAHIEGLDADVDALVGGLRHELRAHVQGIAGLADLLSELEGHRLTDDGRDWCDRITARSERVCEAVDGMVAYLRLGRRELERASVSVLEVAEDVFEAIRARRDDGVPLDLAYEGPDYRVPADRQSLRTALSAIVDNAVRYNRAEVATVRVTATPGDPRGATGGFTVRVADNGVGVQDNDRERVFGLYERRHHDDGPLQAGAGVGLALVALVARRHDGAAWLEPRADGTDVFLHLR